MNALADAVLESSDEEVLEEIRDETGTDPHEEAERVRRLLLEVVEKQKRDRLEVAKQRYKEEVSRIRARQYPLPGTPQGRRDLLDAVLAARPQVGEMLTVQFRELGHLSDADIESLLRKLAELGVLEVPDDETADP